MDGKLRMPDINELELAGRVCSDPKLEYTASSIAMLKFRFVFRNPKNKDDNDEKDFFVSVTVWRQAAEKLEKVIKNGSPLLIYGSITFDRYEKDGKPQEVMKVNARRAIPLDWPADTEQTAPPATSRPPEQTNLPPATTGCREPGSDDDCPF